MKKHVRFLIGFLLLTITGFGQTYIKPNTYYGTQMGRVDVPTTLFFPTGVTPALNSIDQHRAALWLDSLNEVLYVYNPKTLAWFPITGGGGGTDYNFANADLTFDGSHTHDLAGNNLTIFSNNTAGEVYLAWANTIVDAQVNSLQINNQRTFLQSQSGDAGGFSGVRSFLSTYNKATDATLQIGAYSLSSDGSIMRFTKDSAYLIGSYDEFAESPTVGDGVSLYPNETSDLSDYDAVVIDKTTGALVKAPTSLFGGGGGGTTETASNGLNKVVNDIRLGGTLIGTTDINVNGQAYSITDGGTRSIFFNYVNNIAVTAFSTDGEGVAASSINWYGSTSASSNYPGAYIWTSAGSSSSVNTALEVGKSVFTPSIGIGTSIDYILSTGGYDDPIVRTSAILSATGHGSETGYYAIQIKNAGSFNDLMTLFGNGQAQLNGYGDGTFAASPVYGIGVDADGYLVEYTPGGGGGSTTLQNAYDNTVTAGDNPQIDMGNNDFAISNIGSYQLLTGDFDGATGGWYFQNLNQTYLGQANRDGALPSQANISIGASDDPVFTGVSLGVISDGVSNTFTVKNTLFEFERQGDSAKVLIKGAPTYTSTPSYVLTIENDTIKKVSPSFLPGGSSAGTTTNALSVGTGLQFSSGSNFDGSAARTITIDATVATLTGPQTLTNKTLTTPTIGSFANATHNHTNSAGGGTLAESSLALTDITTNNASTSNHGFLKKLNNDASYYMDGTGNWSQPSTGLTSSSFVYNETPSGSVNSSNTSYTLANTPVSGKVTVYINGVKRKLTTDYSVSGTTITMTFAPTTGDILTAEYIK